MTTQCQWVEKYRPLTLDAFIGSDVVKEKIQQYMNTGYIPNLLFYGSSGTGKSSLARIIASHTNADVLYINASDENGIDIVRNKIKTFASTIGFHDIKLVICEEFDYFSVNAQAALRQVMEDYSETTRFILTCNYPDRIIPAIQSRVQQMMIVPPTQLDVARHLKYVLDQEQIHYSIDDLKTILSRYYPDIRKLLHELESHSYTGTLNLTESDPTSTDECLQEIFTGLAQNNVAGIRQALANFPQKDYITVYRRLYDSVTDIAPSHISEAIKIIAEGHYRSQIAIDKEIIAAATLVELLTLIHSPT